MVYKKYIQKNGKLYGPYIYHSKRVGGKVISEYRGTKKDFQWHKFAFAIIGILVLTFLIYSFFSLKSNSGISGNVILNTAEEGDNIDLFLREGELLPASSTVIFETPDNSQEYELSSLVSEETVKGDFYAEGNSLSGTGEGYGTEGGKIIYPTVYFTLISDYNKETIQASSEENSEEPAFNEEEEEQPETNEENTSEEEQISETVPEEQNEQTAETENEEENNEIPNEEQIQEFH